MQITREVLEKEIRQAEVRRDQLLAEINLLIGSIKAYESMRDLLDRYDGGITAN